MKKNTILLTLCFLAINLFAQNEKNNQIGTHFSLGVGGMGHYRAKGGDGPYKPNYYYTIGLDYSRQLSKRWDICSGLEYTYNNMKVEGRMAYLHLATIPVQFKYHMGKVVYVNGGLLFNVLSKLKEETLAHSMFQTKNIRMLFGVGLGVGFEHEFKSGITLSLNPYVRWNGFGGELTYVLLQAGASLGVGYKF